VKRISSGTVTVFVMAIVVGLVAAFVVKQALQPKPQPIVEAPKEPTMPLVVAARNLTENSVVRRGDVRVVQIPLARKKEGGLLMPQIAEGRILRQSLKAGSPVLEQHLHAVGETLPGLESRIPVGMRAMPINVDEQSVVAKMVSIGSHVDIALTVEGTHPDLGELATKTLLHNVEVIAVEKPSASRRGTAANQQATITVAVAPADANMLINAEGTGTLDLTLCSPINGDTIPVSIGGEGEGEWFTRRELLGLAPIPPAPAPPKPFVIEKWEGGNVKTVVISQDRMEEAVRATTASKKFGNGQAVPVNTAPSGVKGSTVNATAPVAQELPANVEVPVSTEIKN
jgi:pilus assembly protein CpaB